MASHKYFRTEPLRVEILRGDGRYFKSGQFGYVVAWDERGGMACADSDKTSRPGERAYLVSKTKTMKGGAIWFSADGIRFTRSKASR